MNKIDMFLRAFLKAGILTSEYGKELDSSSFSNKKKKRKHKNRKNKKRRK